VSEAPGDGNDEGALDGDLLHVTDVFDLTGMFLALLLRGDRVWEGLVDITGYVESAPDGCGRGGLVLHRVNGVLLRGFRQMIRSAVSFLLSHCQKICSFLKLNKQKALRLWSSGFPNL